jgi:hypothetical protein
MSLTASSSLADVTDLAGVCAELPWLADALAPFGDLASVRVESMSGAGGLNAEMSRLCVTFKNARYRPFVWRAFRSYPAIARGDQVISDAILQQRKLRSEKDALQRRRAEQTTRPRSRV